MLFRNSWNADDSRSAGNCSGSASSAGALSILRFQFSSRIFACETSSDPTKYADARDARAPNTAVTRASRSHPHNIATMFTKVYWHVAILVVAVLYGLAYAARPAIHFDGDRENVAVVTGASTGIGRDVALRLARACGLIETPRATFGRYRFLRSHFGSRAPLFGADASTVGAPWACVCLLPRQAVRSIVYTKGART